MSSAQPSFDRLALVSSLYGPGTVGGWYLTTLAIFISWTFHPKKRETGTIDADYIAVLTLPAVAAGHLLYLAQGLLRDAGAGGGSTTAAGPEFAQRIAAIEAPFNVIESFMPLSIVLLVTACIFRNVRRAVLVGTVGLACFIAECYLHFSKFKNLSIAYDPRAQAHDNPAFTRSFMIDFQGLVTVVFVALILCSVAALAILVITALVITYFPLRRRDLFDENGEKVKHDPRTERSVFFSQLITVAILPLGLLSSFPMAHSVYEYTDMSKNFSSRVAFNVFPHTTCSVSDLDQAVAIGVGATVLAFRVYGCVKDRFSKGESK